MPIDETDFENAVEQQKEKLEAMVRQMQGIVEVIDPSNSESPAKLAAQNRIAGLQEGILVLDNLVAVLLGAEEGDEAEKMLAKQEQINVVFKPKLPLNEIKINYLLTLRPSNISPIDRNVLLVRIWTKSQNNKHIPVCMHNLQHNFIYLHATLPANSFDGEDPILLAECFTDGLATLLATWEIENVTDADGLHIEFKIDNKGNILD